MRNQVSPASPRCQASLVMRRRGRSGIAAAWLGGPGPDWHPDCNSKPRRWLGLAGGVHSESGPSRGARLAARVTARAGRVAVTRTVTGRKCHWIWRPHRLFDSEFKFKFNLNWVSASPAVTAAETRTWTWNVSPTRTSESASLSGSADSVASVTVPLSQWLGFQAASAACVRLAAWLRLPGLALAACRSRSRWHCGSRSPPGPLRLASTVRTSAWVPLANHDVTALWTPPVSDSRVIAALCHFQVESLWAAWSRQCGSAAALSHRWGLCPCLTSTGSHYSAMLVKSWRHNGHWQLNHPTDLWSLKFC